MAEKRPLLEQLRADRQRREDEITAPVREELRWAEQQISSLGRRLRAIEAALGSKIGDEMIARAGHDMSAAVYHAVMEAAAKSKRAARDFTVKLPKDIMAFFDPRSVENEILSRYRAEAMPRLSLRVEDGSAVASEQRVTVIDIRMPSLGYRQAVHESIM